jgi:septum formation protein
VNEDLPEERRWKMQSDARAAEGRGVAARHTDALVLGADQLAEVDGRVLGKPESREAARAQLGSLLDGAIAC